MGVTLQFINLRIHIDYNTNVYTKLIQEYLKLSIAKGAVVELHSRTTRPNNTTKIFFLNAKELKT